MFFDSNQINTVINCTKCNERLDEPRLLPCGNSVCTFCVESIKVTDREFQCLTCDDKHEMPKNGLPVIKGLAKILSFSSVNVSRGKAYDTLLETINDLLKKTNILRHRLNNRTEYVKEHCIELKNKFQLATEKAILQMNKFNEQMINEIDNYEKLHIQNNTTSSKNFKKFQQLVDELDKFSLKTNQYLKNLNLNDDILIESNKEAVILNEKADLEIKNLKSVVFDDNIMSFEANKENLKRSILGEIKITKSFEEIMLLCEFPIKQEWDLIYKASEDGFEAAKFHSKCDNKPNTLIIIKSTKGYVFGGYTEQSWSPNYSCKYDSKAFIFSFINKFNKPVRIKYTKKPHNGDNSIVCCSSHGPKFGNDLFIADNSNKNTNSCSYLGQYYIHPDHSNGSNEAQSLLAGSFNFQVSEMEVYTKKI
jgi:hypothetical protein